MENYVFLCTAEAPPGGAYVRGTTEADGVCPCTRYDVRLPNSRALRGGSGSGGGAWRRLCTKVRCSKAGDTAPQNSKPF